MLAASGGGADWSHSVGRYGEPEKVEASSSWVKKGDLVEGEGSITGGGSGRPSEEFLAEPVEAVTTEDMVMWLVRS